MMQKVATLAVCAERFSTAMATTAGVAGLLAGRNDPSSFIIGCLAFPTLNLMISLCPGCHAKVERTKMVFSEMSPLLLVLWRERHPDGPEQTMLAFNTRELAARAVPLTILKTKGRSVESERERTRNS